MLNGWSLWQTRWVGAASYVYNNWYPHRKHFDAAPCTVAVTRTMGMPCSHALEDLYQYADTANQRLSMSDFYNHWHLQPLSELPSAGTHTGNPPALPNLQGPPFSLPAFQLHP